MVQLRALPKLLVVNEKNERNGVGVELLLRLLLQSCCCLKLAGKEERTSGLSVGVLLADTAIWNGCFSVASGGFFTGKGRKTKGFGVCVSPEFGGC